MTPEQIKTRLLEISAECEHGSTSAILEQDAGIDTIEAELRSLANEALEAVDMVNKLQDALRLQGPEVELRRVVEWYCEPCGTHNQIEQYQRVVECSCCGKTYSGRW